MSTADEINKLKKLLDEGTITEEEFNTGKQNILKSEGSKNTKSSKTKKNLISILVFALLVGSAVLIYINLNTTPTVNTDEPIETTTTVTIDKSKAESFNFGIKSSTLKQFAKSNKINFSSPNRREMDMKKLGNFITDSTIMIECWMTVANIRQLIANQENQKAFYSEYKD